jgi:hypothetical protein
MKYNFVINSILFCTYIYQQDRCHRMRPSMFEDHKWTLLLDFPCITGFVMESMHLIDGGLLPDFISALYKLGFNIPNVAEKLEKTIPWMNKFTFLEQARSLRFVEYLIYSCLKYAYIYRLPTSSLLFVNF